MILYEHGDIQQTEIHKCQCKVELITSNTSSLGLSSKNAQHYNKPNSLLDNKSVRGWRVKAPESAEMWLCSGLPPCLFISQCAPEQQFPKGCLPGPDGIMKSVLFLKTAQYWNKERSTEGKASSLLCTNFSTPKYMLIAACKFQLHVNEKSQRSKHTRKGDFLSMLLDTATSVESKVHFLSGVLHY